MATPEAGSQSKPNEVDSLPPKEEMAKMSHSDLYNLRDKLTSAEAVKLVAPYEHRAFAREFSQELPVIGPLSVAAATPLYQLTKLVGAEDKSGGVKDTPASLEQLKEGFKGIAEGVAESVKKPWERVWNSLGAVPEQPTTNKAKVPTNAKPWEVPWATDVITPKAEKFKAEKPKEAPKIPASDRKLSSQDKELVKQAAMTPEEIAADEAFNLTPGNIAELKAEIAKTKDPANKAILQTELDKINEKLKGK